MSNAMKKLKLLHQLTAASSQLPPAPPASAPPQLQNNHQFFTPPASPQLSNTRFNYQHNPPHYTDVLRNARSALQSISHHPAYSQQHSNPPVPATPPQQPQYYAPPPPAPPKCSLPSGFMVLTPTTPNDNIPGLSVPASPTSMAINPSTQHPPHHPLYSSRPPLSNSHTQRFATSSSASTRPKPKLTRDNMARIGKDSRQARWERVNAYVRDQRTAVLPFLPASSLTPEPLAENRLPHQPSPMLNRKRRAEEIAAIDEKVKLLDEQDIIEQQARSLWSGGSGGTNGVDEFVWSEDEDDDVVPMPQAPPPQKVLPREEEMFEMDGGWRDMPRLCREGELEGGLARLVGRRVSAIY